MKQAWRALRLVGQQQEAVREEDDRQWNCGEEREDSPREGGDMFGTQYRRYRGSDGEVDGEEGEKESERGEGGVRGAEECVMETNGDDMNSGHERMLVCTSTSGAGAGTDVSEVGASLVQGGPPASNHASGDRPINTNAANSARMLEETVLEDQERKKDELQRTGGSGSFELGQEFTHITVDGEEKLAQQVEGRLQQPSADGVVVPPSFLCPICMDVMVDPVILATGHTYDRKSIERWLKQGHKTCPVTGMRLRHTELTPNFALKSAIHEWAADNGIELPSAEEEHRVELVDGWEDDGEQGQVLSGHDEIVWALERHGDSLITASADTTVRIWDIPSMRCTHVLEDHRRPVLSLVVTDDYIFSGSYDYTVKVWDWNTKRKVATLRGHLDAVRALIICDGKLFSGSYDGTIKVWSIGEWKCIDTLRGHAGPVRVLATCQGMVFSGSYDGAVRVWDPRSLRCLAVMKGHSSAVRALAATDSYVFSGSDDTTVRVWDANTLCCVAVLEGHEDNVRVLDATSEYLYSGSWDKSVRVWSIPSFNCVQVLEGHTEAVLALAAGEGFVVSGSYDTTLRVWDTGSWRCVKRFEGHNDAIRVLSSSGRRIFSGSYDGGVGIW